MYVDITVHFLFRFYSGTYVLKTLTRITMHLNPYFSKVLVIFQSFLQSFFVAKPEGPCSVQLKKILQYNLCTHSPPLLHPDDSIVFFFLDNLKWQGKIANRSIFQMSNTIHTSCRLVQPFFLLQIFSQTYLHITTYLTSLLTKPNGKVLFSLFALSPVVKVKISL